MILTQYFDIIFWHYILACWWKFLFVSYKIVKTNKYFLIHMHWILLLTTPFPWNWLSYQKKPKLYNVIIKFKYSLMYLYLYGTAYLTEPFSVKTTFDHCFMQLGLGVTIEKRPRRFQQKAGIASGPPWARAARAHGFSLVHALHFNLSSFKKVPFNKLLFDKIGFVKYRLLVC